MTNRIAPLHGLLKDKSLDAIIISSPPLIAYLTGYHGFSYVEREAFLIITVKSSFLLTDARYAEATISSVPHFITLLLSSKTPLSYHLTQIVKNPKGRIGFETDNLSVTEFFKIKKTKHAFVPLSLRDVRVRKDRAEIQLIKKAAGIATIALKKTKSKIAIGMTEKEVAYFLENEIRMQNADIAFPTIVAFGKNASVPHHMTGNTKLKRNDLVLIDFGAKWKGYCSDCTRTFFVGDVHEDWKKIYQTVQHAQQQSIKYLKNELRKMNDKPRTNDYRLKTDAKSIKASAVDKVAREYITSKGFPTIPHSVGHGIGLEVHESPSLSPQSDDILGDGMVFSIEPGIYLPGKLGVRIEDLFVIKKDSIVKLT